MQDCVCKKNRSTFTIEQLPTSSSLEPGPLEQQAYGDTRAQRERERARARRGNVCVCVGGGGEQMSIT